MRILLLLIPISMVLLGLAVAAFVWAVRRGQFDNLDTAALDILEDDDRPAPPPPPPPPPRPDLPAQPGADRPPPAP